MATTLKIQRFIRSVRQGRTAAPVSCTAMAACTRQAYDALLAASWTRVEEREAGLPRHNWAQTGFSPRWDAAKYCGDYADGYQHGYASAVCYTIRMPADALAGTAAKIVSVSIPVRGDRWLADGCGIGIKLSASATPPAWDAAPDEAVGGQLAVVPSNTGSDTLAIVTFDWIAAPKTSLAYLHITLRLTDYLTHRGAWIEGGAMIDGANIAVAFNRNVAPDATAEFDDPLYTQAFAQIPPVSNVQRKTVMAAYTSGGIFGYATPGLADLEYKQALYNFYAKVWDEGSLGTMTPGGYLYRATGSTLARAYAATYVYMLSAKEKTYNRVVFKIASAMNPSTGIDVRLVLYAVNLPSSFNQYNWGTYVYYPSDLIPHQVFAGKAASLSFAAGSGAFRSESATCICNTVLKGGAIYPTGTIFDLKQPFTPDGPTSIQMFLSVNEVVASPGVDTNTPYGLTFLQEHAIWFLP
jgi:hypothetical protein